MKSFNSEFLEKDFPDLEVAKITPAMCFTGTNHLRSLHHHIKTAQTVSVLVDIDSDINYTFHWWVSFVCGNSAACLLFKFAVNPRFLTSRGSPFCMLCSQPTGLEGLRQDEHYQKAKPLCTKFR